MKENPKREIWQKYINIYRKLYIIWNKAEQKKEEHGCSKNDHKAKDRQEKAIKVYNTRN